MIVVRGARYIYAEGVRFYDILQAHPILTMLWEEQLLHIGEISLYLIIIVPRFQGKRRRMEE